MAKKPTPKKAAPKKPAASAKSVQKPAKKLAKAPPPKAKKPTSKPAKPAAKPAAKPEAKPAPKPAAVVKTPPPAPAPMPAARPPEPAPAPVRAPKAAGAAPTALTVSAQSAPGSAANGNGHAANILALVTCGGWPVTDLSRDNFTIMEHFEVPGQTAPFSNNITSFRNAGSGAYLIQVRPINNAPWRGGHHLAQLLVSSPDDRQGQVAVKLLIR